MKPIADLFQEHIQTRIRQYTEIMEEQNIPGIVIYAGALSYYFADDRSTPFVPTPHFSHWCPSRSQEHLLVIEANTKPRLYYYKPKDFWHDQEDIEGYFWTNEFNLEIMSENFLKETLEKYKNYTFIGPNPQGIDLAATAVNPSALTAALDWMRGVKSDYEIYCLDEANRIGALGHEAARKSFKEGKSELSIMLDFLQATSCSQDELPYHPIIGVDQKSAILHYQFKNPQKKLDQVMLIDAGAPYLSYGSDITRTYARDSAPSVFKEILGQMETMQQELCQMVKTGVSYLKLHEACHVKTAQILLGTGILNGIAADSAVDAQLTTPFFPHGLGHMLGLQVHDVAGLQKNKKGDPCEKSERFPKLRTSRDLRKNEVITVEPGLYFIPQLLEKYRAGDKHSSNFNWKLIDELTPCGGIRIEDNVVVQDDAVINLTRKHLGNSYII